MDHSRSLVIARVRPSLRVGWRTGVASAVAAVVGQPALWLFGSLAFTLRGGLVLLVASIVVLPTPIELRMLLGTNLGSAGLTPEFVGLLIASGAAFTATGLAALVLLSHLELSAFERLLRDPELNEQLDGRHVAPPDGAPRRWLLVGLFTLQLVTVGAVALAAIPLVNGVATLAYEEIVRPSLGGTIYVRVFNGVREPLFVLLAGLVLVELMSSLATRRLLLRAYGLTDRRPARGPLASLAAIAQALGGGVLTTLRRPLGTLATLGLAWTASLAVLVPMSWVLREAWAAVRGAYLSPAAASHAEALASLAIVTLALAAIWLVAVLLAGFVSALRAALWSVHGLR